MPFCNMRQKSRINLTEQENLYFTAMKLKSTFGTYNSACIMILNALILFPPADHVCE